MRKKANLAILVGLKGRGSNMAAIANSAQEGLVDAEVKVIIAQSESAPAVQFAKDLGLQVEIIPSKQENYSAVLLQAFQSREIDIICLAGYMRLLPVEITQYYEGRILNIHPALLPKFGGKGMFGIHVHEAVIAAKEKESGCTVHFVTENYDDGMIVVQKKCPVLGNDSAESLAHRVLELEHRAYPEAIQKVWQDLQL